MERAKNDVGLIITGICSVDTIIDSWYWNHPPMYFGKGGYNEYARILKQHVNVPIILAGRMDDPEMANAAIGDCCDIVSYGRPLLADPEYVTKIRYGREEIYGLQPALRKKNILVIGGGVGGMEAARVAALRGHKVTLVEKSDRLGGNLIPGGMPECKHYDHELIRYYERQLELLGVEVKRNTAMTAAEASAFGADEIVVATGSTAIQLPFAGSKTAVSAEDVLMSRVETGSQVVVVGGGLVGCETALWLAQKGKTVTIVEKMPHILGGHGVVPHMNQFMLEDLLNHERVTIHDNAVVEQTAPDQVTVRKGEEQFQIPCDTLICCVGYRANDGLYNELAQGDVPVHNIGDSNKVRNIMAAIWDGYELGRNL